MMLAIVFATTVSQLGALSFPVTGNAQCKKHFTDGMLALHSFMYERAHGEFQANTFADNGPVLDQVFVHTRSNRAETR